MRSRELGLSHEVVLQASAGAPFGQPTYASVLWPLASATGHNYPPAHILKCPSPTWPFQCEMAGRTFPRDLLGLGRGGNDRRTPHTLTHLARHRKAPSFCAASQIARGASAVGCWLASGTRQETQGYFSREMDRVSQIQAPQGSRAGWVGW